MTTDEMLEQRKKTHGSYKANAKASQTLINIVQETMGNEWNLLQYYQQQSIMMICMKLARIAAGNPNEIDHWEDIIGYAELTARELKKRQTAKPRHPYEVADREAEE